MPQVTARSYDPVKQFSVFTENRLGRLFDLDALLRRHEIHILALAVLETADSAIVRVVVDDPQGARTLMSKNGFPFTEADLLAVEIRNESELTKVLGALLEAEIGVRYVYGFLQRPEGKGAVALNVEDLEFAVQALSRRDFRVLAQSDISR